MVARRGDIPTRRKTIATSRAVTRTPALEEGSACLPRRGGGSTRPAEMEGGIPDKKKTKFLFWANTAERGRGIKSNLCNYAIEHAVKTRERVKPIVPTKAIVYEEQIQ